VDSFSSLLFRGIAVVCAINVVLQKHPISSALSLVGVMGSLAVLYLLLGAEFIAMAQMIVYAGAIMVLFIFVIMLLNAGAEEAPRPLLDGAASRAFRCWRRFSAARLLHACAGSRTRRRQVRRFHRRHRAQQSATRFSPTICCPFEVTSVLILIAILGAIVLARKELDDDARSESQQRRSDFLVSRPERHSVRARRCRVPVFRRNIITVFMCIELMLNAVNLSFVAFAYQHKQVSGHIFTFFVMVVAAAEAAVGLAIILTVFKNRDTLNIDEIDSLKN
jgi:NADH:ubiquinone oxidoreductase subunit 6 (subunit J)